MAERRLHEHGWFIEPHLRPGMTVVDVGCGPGTMTVGIGRMVRPGRVVGVDADAAPLELARDAARRSGTGNVTFEQASCYQLPFDDGSVDLLFSHAMLEHVGDPAAAAAEFHRVVRPGGTVGVASPDLRACVLTPPSRELDDAFDTFTALLAANGGDPYAGRHVGAYLRDAGFTEVRVRARFQHVADHALMGAMFADAVGGAGYREQAETLLRWAGEPSGAVFAEAWVTAVGVR